jgi:hypothetical protein
VSAIEKNRWVKIAVTHRLAGLLEDTTDGPLEVMKATTTLSRVVVLQAGGHGHLQGATRHHLIHLHNDPPGATTIVDKINEGCNAHNIIEAR